MRPRRAALVVGLLSALAAGGAPPARGEEPGSLEPFFPLVTRRPVLEREIELRVRHQRGPEGRETETALALDWILLERWQVSLEVPAVFTDPRDRAPAGGIGDLGIEGKVLLAGDERSPLLAAGLALALPTGDRGRGLGGQTAVSPFLTAGAALGRAYLVGELSYQWALARGRAEDLTAGVAAGYRVHPMLIPLLELTAVTRLRRGDEERSAPPLERPQLYLTPGVNVRVLERATLGLGVALPIKSARTFDYALHGSLDWEF